MDRHTENSVYCNTERKSASPPKAEHCPSVSVLTNINKSTIVATIGQKNVQCLLDSGASISCISKGFLSKTSLQGAKLLPSDILEIAGVGGENIEL